MSETLVQEALVELLSESFRRVVCVGGMRVRRASTAGGGWFVLA